MWAKEDSFLRHLISTDFIEDFSVFEGQTIRLKVEELDPEIIESF